MVEHLTLKPLFLTKETWIQVSLSWLSEKLFFKQGEWYTVKGELARTFLAAIGGLKKTFCGSNTRLNFKTMDCR